MLLFVREGFTQVSTFTSNVATSGNWNAPGSWTEAGSDVDNIPDADDNVIIVAGDEIIVTANAAASTIVFSNTVAGARTLTVNTGVVLTIGVSITIASDTDFGNISALIQGLGTLTT